MIRIAVLVSGKGRGTNFQAILDAVADGRIDGEMAVLVATKPESGAVQRATEAGVPVEIVSPKAFDDDEEYYAVLSDTLDRYDPDLVCLAGYMRKIPPEIVASYRGRMMNIHCALVPMFCGPGMYGHRVHEAAIEYGVKFSGCTVHLVDENYDTGPVILQRAVPVYDDDTADTLAERVLEEEHVAYAKAVQLFAQGRLKIEGRRVTVLPLDPKSAGGEGGGP
jgi:phosphoribosylglycinamide formyltransferase-1